MILYLGCPALWLPRCRGCATPAAVGAAAAAYLDSVCVSAGSREGVQHLVGAASIVEVLILVPLVAAVGMLWV